MKRTYKIGIDFDNTVICYDTVFNIAAMEKKLISTDRPMSKNSVRNYLRRIGRENDWTMLQGYVYGEKLFEAGPYAGVKTFLDYCNEKSIDHCIVSHKTRTPYLGKSYDLHKSARNWMEKEGIRCDVFFELTKQEKIRRVNTQGCTHFIDDLPEFLSLPGFAKNLTKILFDPLKQYSGGRLENELKIVNSWADILNLLKQGHL